jgi:hypothetical protein
MLGGPAREAFSHRALDGQDLHDPLPVAYRLLYREEARLLVHQEDGPTVEADQLTGATENLGE